MTRFSLDLLPDDTIEIVVDRSTAQLISDALDVINPDDRHAREWARDCSFTLSTALQRLSPRAKAVAS